MTASGCFLCSNRFASPVLKCPESSGLPCDGCFAVAEIDKNIEETKEKLRNLILSRQDALTRANRCHDPFVCRFPVEIAGNVFRHCLPESPHPSDNQDNQDIQPWTLPVALRSLTMVCKSWNRVACSMPDLWQTLFAKHPQDLYDIDRYLQRSGDLSITIDLKIDTWYWNARQREEVIKSICKYANRWNFLRVHAPHDVITTIAGYTYRLKNPLPRLSFLILRALPPRSGPKPADCFFSIGSPDCPPSSPIHISLQGVKISATAFNFSRLTSIKLASISIPFFLEVLRRAPLLTSLSAELVAAIRFPFHSCRPEPLISHTALAYLKVEVIEAEEKSLFDSISLPSLATLDFSARHHLLSYEYPELRNFLLRSQSPLESLKFSVRCLESELIDILLAAPAIRHLSLAVSVLSSQFFQRLGRPIDSTTAGGNPLLPHLQSLEFYASQISYESFDWSLLTLSVPKSRPRSSRRPISKVTVNMTDVFQSTMSKKHLFDVENIIESGVEVSVISKGEDLLKSSAQLQAALGRLREKKASGRR